MVNMNEVISNNILQLMKQKGVKQIDLANYLGVSKQIVSKMLNGSRMINAIELQKIAEFFSVSMESLLQIPQTSTDSNTLKAFMGKVESEEAQKGLALADEVADLICFYARVRENTLEMMEPWEG